MMHLGYEQFDALLNATATDHQEPHPQPNPPPEGEGILSGFFLHGADFMGFSHFHGSFSNPSPFKGEVRRGMGVYVSL